MAETQALFAKDLGDAGREGLGQSVGWLQAVVWHFWGRFTDIRGG